MELYRLLDPTEECEASNEIVSGVSTFQNSQQKSSKSISTRILEPEMTTIGQLVENSFDNDNPYTSLHKSKLVPQGFLRLLARLEEPECQQYMSYHVSTDHNKDLAYDEYRKETPFVAVDGQSSSSSSSIGKVSEELKGKVNPQDLIWIGGICYHRSLLNLPHTNEVPAFVSQSKKDN